MGESRAQVCEGGGPRFEKILIECRIGVVCFRTVVGVVVGMERNVEPGIASRLRVIESKYAHI